MYGGWDSALTTGIAILGATGSIGLSTLDVVARHPDRYRVVVLTAHRDAQRLAGLCMRYRPRLAVMADFDAAEQLRRLLKVQHCETEVQGGMDALVQVCAAPDVDVVMAAIVGAAGLLPTLAAAQAGKRVLLANKEALVMSGKLFMDAVTQHGAQLLPVDSEHNAIFQCMPAGRRDAADHAGVTRILLTASGGPFRTTALETLASVSPAQACAHPIWSMGRKISVDSATMMNKGLELIEACWLFAVNPQQVEVVIHPQSVIHSMVEYIDGSVLAQLGSPDMRTPIAHALAWPERIPSGVKSLNLFDVGRLDFERPDFDRFPCLRLAYDAAKRGGTAGAVLNAANEVAVSAFLDGRLRFTGIAPVIEATLGKSAIHDTIDLENVLNADRCARDLATEELNRRLQVA